MRTLLPDASAIGHIPDRDAPILPCGQKLGAIIRPGHPSHHSMVSQEGRDHLSRLVALQVSLIISKGRRNKRVLGRELREIRLLQSRASWLGEPVLGGKRRGARQPGSSHPLTNLLQSLSKSSHAWETLPGIFGQRFLNQRLHLSDDGLDL